MRYYERRLPHFDVVGQPLFVTFRLFDSLPRYRMFPPEALTSGKAFVEMDRMLDQAQTGPKHLSISEIAVIVVEAIHDGERRFGRYQLHSFVVMPNHVHLLVTPSVPSAKWLRTLKGFTAHEANLILGRTGNPFWQSESYDHLVRPGEFDRIQRYIEHNPVKAGLVSVPEDFLWSSARACWKQAAG
jgi:putative transposase